MLFKPLLGNQLSGSMGGITASHNRGGSYFRQRAIPVQPNTIEQQIVKAIFGALSTRWNQVLTAAQRDEWDLYAVNTPVLNVIGETITLTGLNMYIRGNSPRIQGSQSIIDNGPNTFGLPSVSALSLATLVPAANTFDLTFDILDGWANEDNAFLFAGSARPQKPTINFFKGPFRFAGTIEGDSVMAPTPPATIDAAFPFNAGDRIYVRAIVVDAQARLSQPQIMNAIAP